MYFVSDMALWGLGEMMFGFFVLCLPAIPKIFTDSSWVHKIVSSLRSVSTTTDKNSSGNLSGAHSSFSRRKSRNPDASLFTRTDDHEFIPLSEVSVVTDYTVTTHTPDTSHKLVAPATVFDNKR
jgi:hypothetical protein